MTEIEQKIAAGILLEAYREFLKYFPLKPCRNEAEYAVLVINTNFLVDMGASVEDHELFGLYEIALGLISLWESEIEQPKSTPRELLKALMECHGLKQKDLLDCASQSTISAFLNGKRGLSKATSKKLAARFCVDVSAFIE
jgi:HTH-type transcriptional regulator/antitoxin HigA